MKPVDEKHARRTLELFEKLYEPLREAARNCGYALTVHGSLRRDIDLVAIPWTSTAVPAADLAQSLLNKAKELNSITFFAPHERDAFFRKGCPGNKPHGRLVWSLHLGAGPYIDLSVMPRGDLYDTAEQILDAMKTLPEVTDGYRDE